MSEVRQDANFTIKERGPRMAQIEKLTIERIEQPNDVLKTPVEDIVEVTKIIQMVQQSSKEQIVDATTSQVVEESWEVVQTFSQYRIKEVMEDIPQQRVRQSTKKKSCWHLPQVVDFSRSTLSRSSIHQCLRF